MEGYKLYSFFVDCGRSGDVEGLFISTPSQVSKIIGKRVYFGEILGKHSEVEVTIKEGHIRLESEEEDKVLWLKELLGETVSGYNPLSYYEDAEEENDDEVEDE